MITMEERMVFLLDNIQFVLDASALTAEEKVMRIENIMQHWLVKP